MPWLDHSDAKLLTNLAAGDLAALGALYQRHARGMLRMACAILRAPEDAEDVVQDIFLRLPERSGRYRPHLGTANQWLSTMTRNACLDRLRRRTTALRIRAALVSDPVSNGTTEVSVTTRLDAARAWHRVEGLAPIYRTTIEALYRGNLSFNELAQREGVAVGTLKSRAARALGLLRAA